MAYDGITIETAVHDLNMSSHAIPAYPQNFAENEAQDDKSIIIDNSFVYDDFNETEVSGEQYREWIGTDGRFTGDRGEISDDGSVIWTYPIQVIIALKDILGVEWDWKSLIPVGNSTRARPLTMKPGVDVFGGGGDYSAVPNTVDIYIDSVLFSSNVINEVAQVEYANDRADGTTDYEPGVVFKLENSANWPTMTDLQGKSVRLVVKTVDISTRQEFDQTFYQNRQMMCDRHAGGTITLVEA